MTETVTKGKTKSKNFKNVKVKNGKISKKVIVIFWVFETLKYYDKISLKFQRNLAFFGDSKVMGL